MRRDKHSTENKKHDSKNKIENYDELLNQQMEETIASVVYNETYPKQTNSVERTNKKYKDR